eukprot:TRINITY_DN76981_c0_g1_i1.p1 TRINITY_DN76981_c0_g1~~TRINITY_DN76981_c0_g1_i1.p1  ORF type:complete len:572 (+),score=56.21 TRINITY_DN76981_c0_g1_i1:59-1774(+)
MPFMPGSKELNIGLTFVLIAAILSVSWWGRRPCQGCIHMHLRNAMLPACQTATDQSAISLAAKKEKGRRTPNKDNKEKGKGKQESKKTNTNKSDDDKSKEQSSNDKKKQKVNEKGDKDSNPKGSRDSKQKRDVKGEAKTRETPKQKAANDKADTKLKPSNSKSSADNREKQGAKKGTSTSNDKRNVDRSSSSKSSVDTHEKQGVKRETSTKDKRNGDKLTKNKESSPGSSPAEEKHDKRPLPKGERDTSKQKKVKTSGRSKAVVESEASPLTIANNNFEKSPILFITLINQPQKWYCTTLRSCVANNITIQVFGWGKGTITRLQKLFVLTRALDDIPPDQLVLFTDGADSVVLGNAEEIYQRYLELGHKIVFSAQKPDACVNKYQRCNYWNTVGPTNHSRLNSGGFIGPAGLLHKLLRHAGNVAREEPMTVPTTDQDYIQYVWHKLAPKLNMTLDYYGKLFWVMYDSLDEFCAPRILDGVALKDIPKHQANWTNCLTGESPLILHFAGISKKKGWWLADYLGNVTTEKLWAVQPERAYVLIGNKTKPMRTMHCKQEPHNPKLAPATVPSDR